MGLDRKPKPGKPKTPSEAVAIRTVLNDSQLAYTRSMEAPKMRHGHDAETHIRHKRRKAKVQKQSADHQRTTDDDREPGVVVTPYRSKPHEYVGAKEVAASFFRLIVNIMLFIGCGAFGTFLVL